MSAVNAAEESLEEVKTRYVIDLNRTRETRR